MLITLSLLMIFGQTGCDAGWEEGTWSCTWVRPASRASDGGVALPSVKIGVRCGESELVCGQRHLCRCTRTEDGGVPAGSVRPIWYADSAHPCSASGSRREGCPKNCYPAIDTAPLECDDGQICITYDPAKTHVVRGCYSPCGDGGDCPSGQRCDTFAIREFGHRESKTFHICIKPEWRPAP